MFGKIKKKNLWRRRWSWWRWRSTSIGILKENISKSMFFKIKKPIDAVLPGRLRCAEIKKLIK